MHWLPLILLVLQGDVLPAGVEVDWDKAEALQLLARATAAADRRLSVEAKDEALAALAGDAYRVKRQPSESIEDFARRAVRHRDPQHPAVRSGQWLSALMRQLYDDLGRRCDRLARFETSRADRQLLETKGREAGEAAKAIGGLLEIAVDGLPGFFEPLPIVGGAKPSTVGALVTVRRGVVNVEGLDRLTFVDDQPPPRAERTGTGALRELFAALRQFNINAELLGNYEPSQRRARGHLRVVIPAAAPARYLNELVHAGVEAKMHTLHVMTMSKEGGLREITAALGTPKSTGRPRAKRRPNLEVRCTDQEAMSQCAARLADRVSKGRAVYILD